MLGGIGNAPSVLRAVCVPEMASQMTTGEQNFDDSWLLGELDRRFAVLNNKVDSLGRDVKAPGATKADLAALCTKIDHLTDSMLCSGFSSTGHRIDKQVQLPAMWGTEDTTSAHERPERRRGGGGYAVGKPWTSERSTSSNRATSQVLPLTEENLRIVMNHLSKQQAPQDQAKAARASQRQEAGLKVEDQESSNDASVYESSRNDNPTPGVTVMVGDSPKDGSGKECAPSNVFDIPSAGGHIDRMRVSMVDSANDNESEDQDQIPEEDARSPSRRGALSARHRRNVGTCGVLVWKFLEDPDSSSLAWFYAWFVSCFVCCGVIFLLAQTFDPPVMERQSAAYLDLTFDCCLLVELVTRLAVCPMSHIRFMQDPFNALDLFSTLLPLTIRVSYGIIIYDSLANGDFRVKIMFCVVPVLRLTKLLRRFQKYHLMKEAFIMIGEAMPVVLFTFVLLALIFSSAIYIVESHGNPQLGTLADALWFCVITMTSVGYGDKVPITLEGRLITGMLTVVSTVYLAMPIGIAGNAFQTVWADRDRVLLITKARDKIREWGYNGEDIPALFRQFDVDSSGELDMDEFRQMITEMGLGLSDDRIVGLFESIDTDGSGSIDDQEFIKRLFPKLYHRLIKKERDRQRRELASESGDGARLTTGAIASWTSYLFKRHFEDANKCDEAESPSPGDDSPKRIKSDPSLADSAARFGSDRAQRVQSP